MGWLSEFTRKQNLLWWLAMGNAVHNAEGKTCHFCGKEFSKSSYNAAIPIREGKMIVYYKCCGACHNAHYEKGE